MPFWEDLKGSRHKQEYLLDYSVEHYLCLLRPGNFSWCLGTPIMHRAHLSLGRMNLGIFGNKRRLLIRLKSPAATSTRTGLSQWLSRQSCWGRARPEPTTSTGPGLNQRHPLDQDWKATSMVAVPSQQPQEQTQDRNLHWSRHKPGPSHWPLWD